MLTRADVRSILSHLHGVQWLLATLLYGSGVRLLECCRLRVKDVDFSRSQVLVRSGKGDKDRVTVLPAAVKPALAAHLERVRAQHVCDKSRCYADLNSKAVFCHPTAPKLPC